MVDIVLENRNNLIANIEKNERTMNSDHLKSFVKIAESCSLTVAAGQLHKTQSTISVQLKNLEETLDTKLFKRSSKGMELTDEGQLLLPRAKRILDEMSEAQRLFKKKFEGTIRIGVPDDYDNGRLEAILASFARVHPGVRIVATSGCTANFSKQVNEGLLDIAVCSGTEIQSGDALQEERIVWAGRSGVEYDLSNKVPLALLERQCWWRNLPIEALDSSNLDHFIAFKCESFSGVCAAISSGIAIGPVPESTLGGNLVELPLSVGLPQLPMLRRYIVLSNQGRNEASQTLREAILLQSASNIQ
ncbi:MAG: LysR family transcriptional regulator [Cyanobacteria bacterium P01_F01_bin.33]